MKTHLPKGLRAALMAALASVSITSYANATDVTVNGDYYGYNQQGPLDLTFKPGGSFNRENVERLYVLTASHTGDVNATVQQSLLGSQDKGYYLVGMNSNKTLNGSLSLRTVATGSFATNRGNVLGLDYSDTVTGNVYMGLADNNTYSGWVYGVMNSTVQGTSKLEIASGTFNGNVAVGYVNSWSNTNTVLNKGTELKITNGTFTNTVAAGCVMGSGPATATIKGGTNLTITNGMFSGGNVVAGSAGTGKSTISGGTHLQINSGTISSRIIGGSMGAGATINDGAHLTINGGALNGYIYGGNYNGNSVINGGIDITINGGTFRGGSGDASNLGIYAAGTSGKVSGDINLTLNGDNVKFDTTDGRYYTISAGWNGSGPVDMSGVTSSKVTLQDLTAASALSSNTSIKVMGGQQGSTLVMQNVIGTINAQLSQFSHMDVIYASDLTLTQDTNATLGGVSSVTINNGSTLTLQNDAEQNWDLSGVKLSTGTKDARLGTLKKTGAGKLTIGDISDFGGGAINVQGGELSLSGSTAAKYLTVAQGATLSVKEGDLFTGAEGAGSSISVSGATLAANEGNWTLNKAATINGATITGSHAVAFGSEIDSNAKVTMSGNINATDGHLILKNTTVATTGATLSGNITFEGVVDNKGTLAIANGSTINIDEESLIRNGRFIDGTDTSASDKNGFFADTEVCLSTGGAYTYDVEKVFLSLDGVKDSKLQLLTDREKNQLLIGGLSLANTYFVREGDVSYSHITDVAETIHRDVLEIAVGNNGAEDSHQLTLDKALAGEVTVVSASDHAKVSISDGVELKASQTAIKGEANEVHVTGAGTVLLDNADKLSTLAGDATMKVDSTKTFRSEAKMTGKLEVVGESTTLTVTDAGTIASFSSVNLAENTKLANEVAAGHEDSIKSLSGSGTLEKTGTGKLAISGDSSTFAGSVSIGGGTLEVQNNMNANTLSGSGKLAKTGEDTKMTVKDASGFTGDIEAIQGTLELEGVALTGAKTQKISVSTGATVNLVDMQQGTDGASIELSIDGGTFGVYADGQDVTAAKVGNLTLAGGSKITIGAGTDTNVLEADLATLSGSILDFSSGGQLTMGCTLDVGKGTIIVLSDDNYALASEGVAVTLFNDVDNTEMENYVRVTLKSASGEQMLGEVNFQSESGDIKLTVKGVPEPTTGTLSLLALAGLCARRRRKH